MIESLESYFAEDDNYAFVILFGSMSGEDAHEKSDVDIAVCFEGDSDMMQAAFDQARLEHRLG